MNCKIMTAEERLGMSETGTAGGEGRDGVPPLGSPVDVVGTSLEIDVSNGTTVGTVEGVGIAETESRKRREGTGTTESAIARVETKGGLGQLGAWTPT